MQRLALKPGNGAARGLRHLLARLEGACIGLISEDGHVQVGQVDPDLMCASGVQRQPQPAEILVAAFDKHIRDSGFTAFNDAHFLSLSTVPADGFFNAPLPPVGRPPAPCQVLALDIVPGKQAAEPVMRRFCFGYGKCARGVFVQPVHNARALNAINAGKVWTVVKQGVNEGALAVAGTGVHDNAC